MGFSKSAGVLTFPHERHGSAMHEMLGYSCSTAKLFLAESVTPHSVPLQKVCVGHLFFPLEWQSAECQAQKAAHHQLLQCWD